jgi:hypothetical protein
MSLERSYMRQTPQQKRELGLRWRRRLARAAVTAGAVFALGIAIAGCGGDSSGSGVAHLSTGTSGGSAASGGGSSSPENSASTQQKMVAYAQCMRTHGVPNFPDPTSSGQVTHKMLAKAGVDVHQPAVPQAADACVSVTHGALTKAAVARFAAGH